MKHGSDTMRRAPWLVVGLLLLVGCGIQDGKAECIHGGDPGAGCSLPSVSTCPSGQTFCEGTGCVDTSSASNHCGACGSACPVGQTCSDGNCVPSVVTCTDGLAFCAGAGCVDLSATPDHCGECGRRCESGDTCRDGGCYAPTDAGTPMDVPVDVPISCASGLTRCSGFGCTNLNTDAFNCAACGRACPSGQTCTMGYCACPSGLTLCGGACTNTQNDRNNCGGCNRWCGDATCVSGYCMCTDPAYPHLCPASPRGVPITCFGRMVECDSVIQCSDGSIRACLDPGYSYDCTTGLCSLTGRDD